MNPHDPVPLDGRHDVRHRVAARYADSSFAAHAPANRAGTPPPGTRAAGGDMHRDPAPIRSGRARPHRRPATIRRSSALAARPRHPTHVRSGTCAATLRPRPSPPPARPPRPPPRPPLRHHRARPPGRPRPLRSPTRRRHRVSPPPALPRPLPRRAAPRTKERPHRLSLGRTRTALLVGELRLALDVDPPAGQPSGEARVLPLFADRERELVVGHNHERRLRLGVDEPPSPWPAEARWRRRWPTRRSRGRRRSSRPGAP